MAFTAKDVQTLREMTGVGMMDCKKALQEADGNIDSAVKILREKGMAAAAKKAGRVAAEGMCHAIVCPKSGVAALVEVNIETDFAAKNEEFKDFVKTLAFVVADEAPADVDALKQCEYPESNGRPIEKVLQDKVLKIGENIQIRRFDRVVCPLNAVYIHMGGKIAVVVSMDVSENLKDNPDVSELGRDVAMQIAAMRPLWLDETVADQTVVNSEKEIITQQLKQDEANAKKSENVLEKIVEGRIRKYLAEVCLLKQAFVKESKTTVGDHVAATARALHGEIKVASFVRYEVGEGLQKREENFADEVAKMTK
ncbi:MAG: translation elongation factor Ts [Oscillospiraceae bacterium]|nr:translation elongation factor Ts [Oscillospiraceae bacterium]